MTPVSVIRGSGPIILAQPHSGTDVPDDVWSQLNDLGRQLLDTDWHVPTLYEDLLGDATIVRANFSRYIIDANRDPADVSLYPGQNTTSLVPKVSFDGEPIWREAPSEAAIDDRLQQFHKPYHAALSSEIARIKSIYGVAVLYDCHSIRSLIPHLFEGTLPDLNIGTFHGASCGPFISEAILRVCKQVSSFTHVFNGRFAGGWTTRHYGHPDHGVHAIQMELAQRLYLKSETPPFSYDEDGAVLIRGVLRQILDSLKDSIATELGTEN